MSYIIGFLVLYWIAKRLEAIRQAHKARKILEDRERVMRYQREQKALEAYRKQQAKEQAQLAREQAKLAKEQERQEKLYREKLSASSNLEYVRHRMKQLEDLIDYEVDKQEGTTHGSKEWEKHERKIMTYESQYQTLKIREAKAKAILAK